MKKQYIYIIISILILVLIDQITKNLIISTNEDICIIDGVLQFTYVENTGGAFSLGQKNLLGIIITNIIVLGIVIRFMIVQFEKMDKWTKICITLIISGGISNFVDRIIRGFVVDFIDFTQIINFPIFNLADIYIVVGWILFVILTIKYAVNRR